jgi:hypothetical protein
LHYHSSDRDRANHTGTQAASTISDFDTEVSNNSDVSANTSARHSAVTVTDTDSVDLSLTGQALSADVLVDDSTIEIDEMNGVQVKDGGVTFEKIAHTTNVRQLLGADTTYYVSTSGNDTTGDGSVGTPWATIQHAIDYLVEFVDTATYNVTIQLVDGTYTDSGTVLKTVNGAGKVTIQGNSADNTDVIVNSSNHNFRVEACGTPYVLQYMTLRNSGTNKNCVQATLGANINLKEVSVDATNSTGSYSYIFLSQSTALIGLTDCEFGGDCNSVLRCQGGTINCYNTDFTLNGTCDWAYAFYLSSEFGGLLGMNITFNGSGTGKRYSISINSYARISTTSTTYFPGDVAGTVDGTSHYG